MLLVTGNHAGLMGNHGCNISPMNQQSTAIEKFRLLHQSGCFVLPNPWDVGSAIYLAHIGFKALASTSAGFAFTRGLPDSPVAVPLDLMLEHFKELATATALPVNADFQNGFAHEPDGVAANVTRCIATGVAGLSIEDSTGETGRRLYDFDRAVDRIRAARAAIDASGVPVILTARCEAWLVGDPDPFRTSLERLAAYAEAGADCLYAPAVRDDEQIAAIVRTVSPKPVNVLAFAPDFTVKRLADLGVRRISVGSALARVAWAAFVQAARSINETGTFLELTESGLSRELNDLFSSRLVNQRSAGS